MNIIATAALLLSLGAPQPGSRGPIAVRIDGLGDVNVEVKVALPIPLPGDLAEQLSGLSNARRLELRTRLAEAVRERLTKVGFDVQDKPNGLMPLFVVQVESYLGQRTQDPILVRVVAEIREPGIWARDPEKRGMIPVFSMLSSEHVSRKDLAKAIERQALARVEQFTDMQQDAK